MKQLFTLLLASVMLFGCSKNNNSSDITNVTLQVLLEDYKKPNTIDHVWAVKLQFDKQMIIKGSLKVDFDVYSFNTFFKHFTQKVNFDIVYSNYFLQPTNYGSAPAGQGLEVRNIIVDSLTVVEGNYNITIK